MIRSPPTEPHKHIFAKVTRRKRGWREEGKKEESASKRQKDSFSAGLPG